MTVSTVGLAPAIRKLADEDMSVRLAVSLHTPDDELRDTLVPVNNRWKVAEALDAAPVLRRRDGQAGVDRVRADSGHQRSGRGARTYSASACAAALGPLVHVNVIPLNPTPGSEWDASSKAAEREFVRRVRERGVSCTVRDTRGREIAAACGQLAAEV